MLPEALVLKPHENIPLKRAVEVVQVRAAESRSALKRGILIMSTGCKLVDYSSHSKCLRFSLMNAGS